MKDIRFYCLIEYIETFSVYQIRVRADSFPARAAPLSSIQAMYWPLGAPRVYAADRRKRKPPTPEYEEEGSEDGEEKVTSILGLRVARNGHLFVTITETTLTVWQTSVRIHHRNVD